MKYQNTVCTLELVLLKIIFILFLYFISYSSVAGTKIQAKKVQKAAFLKLLQCADRRKFCSLNRECMMQTERGRKRVTKNVCVCVCVCVRSGRCLFHSDRLSVLECLTLSD